MRTLSLSLVVFPLLMGCAGSQSAPANAPRAQGDDSSAQAAQQSPAASIVVTPEMGSPHPGEPAPELEGLDQSGNSVKLSSFKSSVVVLAFVTSWCPFSAAEQPHLAQL